MVFRSLLAATALILSFSAQADVKHGKELHNKNCVACHKSMTGGDGSTLYTRSSRRVKSLGGLEAQVRRCESNLGLRWFDEDIDAVVKYLNANYYKFATQ